MIIGRETLWVAFRNSEFNKFAKNLSDKYHRLEDKLEELYSASVSCCVMRISHVALKNAGEYSFSKRIADKMKIRPFPIDDSRIVGRTIFFIKNKTKKIIVYSKESAIGALIHRIGEDFREDTLKTVSTIVVIALITSAVFTAVFKNDAGPFGWVLRAVFVLLAALILVSDLRWQDVKEESVFIKFFTMRNWAK